MKATVLNNLLLFLCLNLIFILLDEAGVFLLKINQLTYQNLSELLTYEQLKDYLENKARWGWLKYLLLPISLFIKVTILSWILAIGGFFCDVKLVHKEYLIIVLQAEFVFMISALVKLLWFVFIQPEFSLEEVQQFVPFSIQSILDISAVPIWALYPLQLANVFELLYWGLLAVSINQASNSKKGFVVVASSYGPALFIWMIFIMFLTLNLS